MADDPTDDIREEVEEADSRIDAGIETLADHVANVASDVNEAKGYIEALEEDGATADQIDDLRDEVEDRFDDVDDAIAGVDDTVDSVADDVNDVNDAVDDVSDTVDDVGSAVDSVSDDVGDVNDAVDEVGERVASEAEETRDAVSDVGDGVDEVADSVEDVSDSVDEVGDTVESEAEETRGAVEDVGESVDEVGDDVEEVADELSELGDELIQELLDEKDARREDVAAEKDARREEVVERMQQLVNAVDSQYNEDQLETLLTALARKDLKHNNDMMGVVGHLFAQQGDGPFDHAAYQNIVGSNAQAYGIDGVDTVDAADPEVARTLRSLYGQEGGDFAVLSDPLTGMNAWNDKDGYGNVLRHTWTRLVDEVADYMAEMDAEGADVGAGAKSRVLDYLGEAGERLESVADEGAHGNMADRQLSALLYLDHKAQEVDRHLQAGQYEEAVDTLDEAYGDAVAEMLDGDVAVGA